MFDVAAQLVLSQLCGGLVGMVVGLIIGIVSWFCGYRI